MVADLCMVLVQMLGGGGRGWSNLLLATVVIVELLWVLRDGAINVLTTSGLSLASLDLLLFLTTQTMMKIRMRMTMIPSEMTRTRMEVDSPVVGGYESCRSTLFRGNTFK